MKRKIFGILILFALISLNKKAFASYSWLHIAPKGKYLVRCVQEVGNNFQPTFSYKTSQKGKIQTQKMKVRFDGTKDLTIDGKLNKDLYPIKVFQGIFKAHSGSQVSVQCGSKEGKKNSWIIPDFKKESVPNFVIFGDSGCNPQKFQYCPLAANKEKKNEKEKTTRTTWEYPKLVEHALKNFPKTSFFVHVGDYVYQGGYGFKDGLSKTATWDEWEADFFAPSKIMLEAMPGLFIRGNHETFGSNSGLGWFILLDPYKINKTAALEGLKNKNNKEVLTRPWKTDLSKKVKAVIWDNSVTNLYGDPFASGKTAEERMKDFIKDYSNKLIKQTFNSEKEYWLFAHVPLFGLNEDGDKFDDPEDDGPDDLENIVYQTNFKNNLNQSKKSDIGTRQGWLRMYDKATNYEVFKLFSYYIAGDIHTMQEVRPKVEKGEKTYPTQVICGGSGVKLDKLAECINLNKKPCQEVRFNQVSDYAFKDSKNKDKGHWGVKIPVSGRGVKAVGYITHQSLEAKKGSTHQFTIQQIRKEEKIHN